MNGDADTLALKVLGGTDAGPAIDINVAVAKDARGKDRERHERTIAARHAADEFGAGEFRNVELLRAAHAIKNVARLVDGEEFEIDALHLHVAGAQGFDVRGESGLGRAEELGRRVNAHELSRFEQGDARAEQQGLAHVVRHENYRLLEPRLQGDEPALKSSASSSP